MNGRCKPPEQGSGQKNKEIWRIFKAKNVLGHFWRGQGGYCPPATLQWLYAYAAAPYKSAPAFFRSVYAENSWRGE